MRVSRFASVVLLALALGWVSRAVSLADGPSPVAAEILQRLREVSVGDPPGIVISDPQGVERRLTIGEDLGDGWSLAAVSNDRIVLRRGAATEVVDLADWTRPIPQGLVLTNARPLSNAPLTLSAAIQAADPSAVAKFGGTAQQALTAVKQRLSREGSSWSPRPEYERNVSYYTYPDGRKVIVGTSASGEMLLLSRLD